MADHYEKINTALKEIRKIQELIAQGLAKSEEKDRAVLLAEEAAELFTDDIFKRKVEKLSKATIWTKVTRDGFVSEDEADQLTPWVNLLDEYTDGRKIKTDLSSEKIHIRSVVDGEDQHIFITEKGSDSHSHLILDGETGEIRIDPKDKTPHELIKSIKAELELKTGEIVQITESSLNFVEPDIPEQDVKVYTANKDGYFVLEIYNNGNEDLEEFEVKVGWEQPPPEGVQERILQKFNDVSDYLVMSRPRSLNMLAVGAKIYAIHVPSISVDKKLKVTVTCKGVNSGKKITRDFNLETPNQYGN